MSNGGPFTSQSKTSLLSQVDALRDVARRVRRLSKTIARESDQRRLARHAEELDETATRLEAEAAEVKV
jgi:predicted metal-dependent hydrolase